MIFRQLFEPESSTYTYLFGCRETGQAILLDPVMETVERDLATIQQPPRGDCQKFRVRASGCT